MCRKAEQFLSERNKRPRSNNRLHEIEYSDHPCHDTKATNCKNDPELEAFGNPHKSKDVSNIRCYNVESVGHIWKDCPSDERRMFCYKCGKADFTTPKYPNCKGPENFRRSVGTLGAHQSINRNLDS